MTSTLNSKPSVCSLTGCKYNILGSALGLCDLCDEEFTQHWRWLGAKTPAESGEEMEREGLDKKAIRRFNKCLDQIEAKCLCGEMKGKIKFCEFRKGKKRCGLCKVGGNFFPWDEEDIELLYKLDLDDCYDLDFGVGWD